MSFKVLCSYYCGALTFVGIFFFAILFTLEYQNSEYLEVYFHNNNDGKDRKTALAIVILINVVIFITLMQYGNKESIKDA
jgi:hypothetical protein